MTRHEKSSLQGIFGIDQGGSRENDGMVVIEGWNNGGNISKGRVVCYYASSGHAHNVISFGAFTGGYTNMPATAGGGVPNISELSKLKIMGVALTAINSGAQGPVCIAGLVDKVWTNGAIATGDWLKLGGSPAPAGTAQTTTTIGNLDVFAIALGVTTGGNTRTAALVLPYRQ